MNNKNATKIISGLLLQKTGLNFQEFAKQNGFGLWNVYKAVEKWWGREDMPRSGSQTFRIIESLKEYCHNA